MERLTIDDIRDDREPDSFENVSSKSTKTAPVVNWQQRPRSRRRKSKSSRKSDNHSRQHSKSKQSVENQDAASDSSV